MKKVSYVVAACFLILTGFFIGVHTTLANTSVDDKMSPIFSLPEVYYIGAIVIALALALIFIGAARQMRD